MHLCTGFKHEKREVELRVEGGIQVKRARAQPQNLLCSLSLNIPIKMQVSGKTGGGVGEGNHTF